MLPVLGRFTRSGCPILLFGCCWEQELPPASETAFTKCKGNSSGPVSPGHKVTASIVKAGTNKWTISLSYLADHWTWTKTVAYSSTESSAEWILEAPTVEAQTTLADVGTVKFGPTSTYVADGRPHTPSQKVRQPRSSAGRGSEFGLLASRQPGRGHAEGA